MYFEIKMQVLNAIYLLAGKVQARAPTPPNAGEDEEQEELSFIANGNAKCRRFGQFFTKPSMLLPRDPAFMLLGTYPEELKTYAHRHPT